MTAAAAAGRSRWGLRDLTFFVTAFHYTVIEASNATVDGFEMDRVVARVDAFFAQNNAGTQTHGRYANWTLEAPGALLLVTARNWRVVGCDLFSTYNGITSMATSTKAPCNANSWPNGCHGASYGRVADNVITAGGATHFMNG